MPKSAGKRRTKGSHVTALKKDDTIRGSLLSDDCESYADNDHGSVISYSSSKWECGSDDGTFEDNGGDETSQSAPYFDDFEEKLSEAIDGTADKRPKTRLLCFEAIKKALTTRFCWEYVMDRKVTIADLLERAVKRKGEELGSAAILSSVVCITMGTCTETDQLFHDLQSHLTASLADASVAASVRSKCATALGLGCFITNNGIDSLELIMESLQSIFAASYFKGNGAIPVHTPEISSLHSSALNAWTLLLTILTPSVALRLADKHMKKISQLLDSPDVELRIAAGECIAVLHEIARECNEEYQIDVMDDLCDKLRQLATDSQKFRAKKDRRQQRSSFRDVLKAVEEREPPIITYKFGRERLTIDSWCRKRQYDALCDVLKSGMNLHLCENELMREIFALGPSLSLTNSVSTKISKFERNMENIAACKARTKSRNKLRDRKRDIP